MKTFLSFLHDAKSLCIVSMIMAVVSVIIYMVTVIITEAVVGRTETYFMIAGIAKVITIYVMVGFMLAAFGSAVYLEHSKKH